MAAARYIVDDLDTAVDFYHRLLGFQIDLTPGPGFAALSRDELELYLNIPGAGGAGRAGGEPRPGGWNRIQVEVDDLEEFVSELEEKGARFRGGIVEGKGGSQILLEDPSGNPVELYQSRGTGPDPIPSDFHAVTPFLAVSDVGELATFIIDAFGGTERYRMTSEDGVIRHAVVAVGGSPIMLSSAEAMYGGGWSAIHVYVEDVDVVYEQALRAGARSLREPANQFYGDRSAGVEDRWGNQWWIATHVEDVGPEEMKRREREFRLEKA